MTFEKPRHSRSGADAALQIDDRLALNAIMAVAVTARKLRVNCQNQPSRPSSRGPGSNGLTDIAAEDECHTGH